jgi:hypothetical protein
LPYQTGKPKSPLSSAGCGEHKLGEHYLESHKSLEYMAENMEQQFKDQVSQLETLP